MLLPKTFSFNLVISLVSCLTNFRNFLLSFFYQFKCCTNVRHKSYGRSTVHRSRHQNPVHVYIISLSKYINDDETPYVYTEVPKDVKVETISELLGKEEFLKTNSLKSSKSVHCPLKLLVCRTRPLNLSLATHPISVGYNYTMLHNAAKCY